MDEKEKQEKRRYFHSEQVLVPATDCLDFVIYPNGLLSHFEGHRSSGNEKVILFFLVRHMSQQTVEGETTDFKDISQTFWCKHDYISERTGLRKSRISDAIKSLVESGILLHVTDRGVGQHIAFSEKAINAWIEFSQIQALSRMPRSSGKRNRAVPVSGTGQFRLTEPGSSGERNRAVPVSGTSSYIEDKSIGSKKGDLRTDKRMDGCKAGDKKPASMKGKLGGSKALTGKNMVGWYEITKEIELTVSKRNTYYVVWGESDEILSEYLAEKGEKYFRDFHSWVRSDEGWSLANSRSLQKRGMSWRDRLRFFMRYYNELRANREDLTYGEIQ